MHNKYSHQVKNVRQYGGFSWRICRFLLGVAVPSGIEFDIQL